MAQPDPDGERLSSKWVEASRERPARPSPLYQAAKGLHGHEMASESVAVAAEKELVDLVFAVASTTLEMHRMAVDRAAPSVPLWSLARVAADAMGRIFLICTEPQELKGWVKVRRRNTHEADKFWAELVKLLPEGVRLPADLMPRVDLGELDAALAVTMEELPGGLGSSTDTHRRLAEAACARMMGVDVADPSVAGHAGILQALYRLAGDAVHLSSPLTFDRQKTAMCFGWLGILTPEALGRFRRFAGARSSKAEEERQ